MVRLPLVTTDLDALLRQVAQRDVDAFATFYDLTRARVFGLVTRVLRDPGYSEETTQDDLPAGMALRGQLRPDGGLAAGMADDGGAPARSGPRSLPSRPPASASPATGRPTSSYPPTTSPTRSSCATNASQVTDCLGSLTDVQRECIQLAYYDGLTYVQVSERLSANLATIKSRMRDAIRGLRKCLGLRMTEPTESRPDGARNALRAACDDRVRTRRRRAADRRRPARGGSGVLRRGARRARDDGGGVGGDGRRTARTHARPAARRPSPKTRCANSRPGARTRWRTTDFGGGGGARRRPRRARRRAMRCGRAPPTSTAEQVFAAPDVRTVSGPIPGGGTATLVFSHEKDAGVLVMNNVAAAAARHRVPDVAARRGIPKSAGTMDAKAVAPSTTAVLPDLGTSRALAFTVEPGSGSAAADRRGFRRTAAGLTRHSSVAAAASASTSAMSCLRCHARRCRIAPLPCSAMRASSVRTMS